MTLQGDLWVELYNNLGTCDKTDWELNALVDITNTSCASLAAETLLFNVYRINDNNLYFGDGALDSYPLFLNTNVAYTKQ